jgi:hypothetical protein
MRNTGVMLFLAMLEISLRFGAIMLEQTHQDSVK